MKVFISYSRSDLKHKNKFRMHLAPLVDKYGLTVFDDRAILAGDEWEKRIWSEFGSSKVIILLISANFLSSEFCLKKEFAKAMIRHEKKRAVVVPVILSSRGWRSVEGLAKLQALPDGGEPIHGGKFRPIDKGFANAITEINKLLALLTSKKRKKAKRPMKPTLEAYKQTRYKLAFFDLDGTLVRGKVGHEYFRYSWQLVWSYLKHDDAERKLYYQEYEDKRISYQEWCDITLRIFRKDGLMRSQFAAICQKVRLTKNCKETLKILQATRSQNSPGFRRDRQLSRRCVPRLS